MTRNENNFDSEETEFLSPTTPRLLSSVDKVGISFVEVSVELKRDGEG